MASRMPVHGARLPRDCGVGRETSSWDEPDSGRGLAREGWSVTAIVPSTATMRTRSPRREERARRARDAISASGRRPPSQGATIEADLQPSRPTAAHHGCLAARGCLRRRRCAGPAPAHRRFCTTAAAARLKIRTALPRLCDCHPQKMAALGREPPSPRPARGGGGSSGVPCSSLPRLAGSSPLPHRCPADAAPLSAGASAPASSAAAPAGTSWRPPSPSAASAAAARRCRAGALLRHRLGQPSAPKAAISWRRLPEAPAAAGGRSCRTP